MIREERFDKIIDFVKQKKYASIHEIQNYLKTSKATVRRDLDTLAKMERIELTRGGARNAEGAQSELLYHEKYNFLREEKIRISSEAVKAIKENSTILLDTGTTTRELVPFLLQMKNIQVLTNDVLIATELAANCNIEVFVTGGSLRKGYYTLKGFSTEDFLKQIRVDITFLSLDAVDVERGLMITNMDEVIIKQRMIHCAEQVIALCDHKKFEKTALCKVCDLGDVDKYIVGKELSEDTVNLMRLKKLTVSLV